MSSFTAPGVAPFQDPTGDQLREVARGVDQLGAGTLRLQREIDEARVDEEVAFLQEKHGEDLDAYRLKEGRDAVDGYDGLLKGFDERRKTIESRLQSPEQRSAFRRQADLYEGRFRRAATDHHGRAALDYRVGAQKARLEATVRSAAQGFEESQQGPQDPGQVSPHQLNAALVKQQARELAAMQGLSPEEAALLELDSTTRFHDGVIRDRLARGRADQAREYLEGLPASEIDGAKATVLRALVQQETLNDEGRRRADEALAGARARLQPKVKIELPLGGGEVEVPIAGREDFDRLRAQALADLEAQKLPTAVYDNAVGRIVRQTALLKDGQTEADKRNLEQAAQTLIDHPELTWHDLPADVKRDLVLAGKGPQLEEFSRTRQFETSKDEFAELVDRTEDEWARTDWGRFQVENWGKLGKEAMDFARLRIAAARRDARPEDLKAKHFDDAVEVLAKNLGILPRDEKPELEQTAVFESFLVQARELRRTQPNVDDAKILEQLRDADLGKGKNLFSATPEERAAPVVSLPNGRQVFMQTVPRDRVLLNIRAENAARREQNRVARQTGAPEKPLIPETPMGIAQEWDRFLQQEEAEARKGMPHPTDPSVYRYGGGGL